MLATHAVVVDVIDQAAHFRNLCEEDQYAINGGSNEHGDAHAQQFHVPSHTIKERIGHQRHYG